MVKVIFPYRRHYSITKGSNFGSTRIYSRCYTLFLLVNWEFDEGKVIISQDVPSDCKAQPHDVKWQGFMLIEKKSRPLSMEERMVDLKQMLSRFLTIPGVRLTVLVGRDGLLIEGLSRDGKEDMETVGAYMTTGLNTAEALGQEISRGGVVGVLTEYEHGLVSVDPLGDFALVVTLFDNASSIGRVRHMVKASRNEILQALDIA